MNEYTKKEKLLAMSLLGAAKAGVAEYAEQHDQSAGVEAALLLAEKYARYGADLSVIDELEYPEPSKKATLEQL